MTKKNKILSITCGVLAVVVVGSYFALNRNNAVQAMVSTETLQQMDLQNTVSLSGVVESQSGRKVYSTLSYLVAVSYTHLDVYKRQFKRQPDCTGCKAAGCRRTVRSSRLSGHPCPSA